MKEIVKSKKKKRWIKWVIIAAVVVIIILLLVLKGMRAASDVSSMYDLEAAQKRDLTVIVNATGIIEPETSYTLSPSVSAEVLEMHVKLGDKVKKGDIICVLDASDYEPIYQQSKDGVRSAELSLEQAKLALENAGIGLSSYSDAYDDLSVSATGRSQVIKHYFEAGDSVAAGTPVAELQDNSTMRLEVPFNASDAASIMAGSAAKVTVLSTGDVLDGTVTKVSGVDTVTSYGGIVRTVTISVKNPGAVTAATRATASVGSFSCSAAGAFSYNERETLYATATGKIGAILVPEGGWVEAGGAVLTIESSAVESQYQTAQSSVKSAQLSVQASELALETAKLSLQTAQDTMDEYTVRAKADGVIATLNYEVGDIVTPALPVATIINLDSVKFDLQIDELDIGKTKPGQTVNVTADAVSGESFVGTVSQVGISGKGASGVTIYPVTVVIQKPGGLLPGMNVTADIIVDEVSDVLTIPVSAVLEGDTVLVPEEGAPGDPADGVLPGYKRVSLVLGRSDDDYIEVLSGLSEGDMVAVDKSTSSAWQYIGF